MRHGQNRRPKKGYVPIAQKQFHGMIIHWYNGMQIHQKQGRRAPLITIDIGPNPKKQSKGNMDQKNCTFG